MKLQLHLIYLKKEDLTNKLVLIIEDEQQLLSTLQQKLTEEGVGVITAHDGEEGYKMAIDKHPDLLILDTLLPTLGGMKILEYIRLTRWGEALPIMILSNLEPDDQTITQLSQLKPAYYLIKTNTSLDEIIKRVKELLKELDKDKGESIQVKVV